MSKKKTFVYKGSVENTFGYLINQWWEAETTAVSAKKARANLAYRYSKIYDCGPVSLPGKIIERSDD